MSRRFLPPLEAETSYRVADFQSFEYGHATLRGPVTGEYTSILHLHLKNRTTLDLPVSDEALHHLLRTLISAFPVEALLHIQQQPWCPENVKTWKPEQQG